MSETNDGSPAFLAPRAAAWFCALLLVAFGGVVAFSFADQPRAAAVEQFSQTTAVGDTNYYTPPNPPLAVPDPVLTWQGRAWAPLNYNKWKLDDPRMTRVGRDDATGFTLYRPRAGGPDHFVKTDIGEYLRVQAR